MQYLATKIVNRRDSKAAQWNPNAPNGRTSAEDDKHRPSHRKKKGEGHNSSERSLSKLLNHQMAIVFHSYFLSTCIQLIQLLYSSTDPGHKRSYQARPFYLSGRAAVDGEGSDAATCWATS